MTLRRHDAAVSRVHPCHFSIHRISCEQCTEWLASLCIVQNVTCVLYHWLDALQMLLMFSISIQNVVMVYACLIKMNNKPINRGVYSSTPFEKLPPRHLKTFPIFAVMSHGLPGDPYHNVLCRIRLDPCFDHIYQMRDIGREGKRSPPLLPLSLPFPFPPLSSSLPLEVYKI